jgi:hypothetical protein
MRRSVAVLVLAALLLFAGCAVPSGPALDDAQRCARFGGTWTGNTCGSRGGA